MFKKVTMTDNHILCPIEMLNFICKKKMMRLGDEAGARPTDIKLTTKRDERTNFRTVL